MTDFIIASLASYRNRIDTLIKHQHELKDDVFSLKMIEAHLSLLVDLNLAEMKGKIDEAPEPREDKEQSSVRSSVGGKVQRRKNSG